jgi:hypothetical protein
LWEVGAQSGTEFEGFARPSGEPVTGHDRESKLHSDEESPWGVCVPFLGQALPVYLTPPQSGFLPRIEVHHEQAERAVFRADDFWNAPSPATRRIGPEQSSTGATATLRSRPRRICMNLITDQRETGAFATRLPAAHGGVGRMRGAMLWFNPAKQHGFVRTEDGERLRVEVGGFAPGHELGDRCAGTVVEFDRQAAECEGGYVAMAVTVVDNTPGRRARSHRGQFRSTPRR